MKNLSTNDSIKASMANLKEKLENYENGEVKNEC
jgi:hypothetical protein